MIDAIEVHEGSWVKTTNDAIFNDEWKNRCCPLSKDDMIHIITYGCEERYVGIELTSELLEKCGFKHWAYGKTALDINDNSSLEYWEFRPIQLYLVVGGECNDLSEAFTTRFPHIQYLHQLQNLFFALTGNKLEVNF